jgi:hypothetical protein
MAQEPAQRNDAWTVIGPGGGGTMIDPTVSPHDPNLVCLRCDMTGAYVSADGGDSWRMVNLRSWVTGFAFDPSDPNVIYTANAALWRSEDAGRTWAMAWPDPAGSVEHMRSDHADYCITSESPDYPSRDCRIARVAVDPSDSARLYLALERRDRPTQILCSNDRGATWAPAAELPRQRIFALYVHPRGGVCVVGARGVLVGQGDAWRSLSPPVEDGIRHASVGCPAGADRPAIYASVADGVCISPDAGEHWHRTGLPPEVERPAEIRFRAVACCSTDPSVAYAGIDSVRVAEGPDGVLGGIVKTTDGGRSWTWVLRERNRPAENMFVSWIEGRARNGRPNLLFVGPSSLCVGPNDPNLCFASDMFRTYRTIDGGGTWQQINSVRVGEDRWTTTGLDVTTCYGLHVDPFDRDHLFISYTDIGLFHSRDGGASWTGATRGIPNRWRNTTYWVAFDPDVGGRMWGAFAHHHDLPRTKMWRRRERIDYRGGVARSDDGGESWTLTNEGMPETAATHILLDPDSPADQRTLYVCGFGRGVFKSVDDGRTWERKSRGIDGVEPFAWRITRAGDGTLYLVVARRSDFGRIGDEGDGALYRSTDAAETWTRMPLPDGVNGPVGFTLDREDASRMYLAAWALAHPDGPNTGGGIYLSEDGGRTWRCVFDRVQHVYDVTADPRDPRVLYCCGFESSAWRSTDRGETWSRLRGYNFHWGHRVLPDPTDAEKVYIATYGGSVWHGPAAGDPDAPEDDVPRLPHEA